MKYSPIILCWCVLVIAPGLINQEVDPSPKSNASPPCNEPLTWTIGRVDPEFDISRDSLQTLVLKVGDLWSDAAGQPVLQYRDSGRVEVNLIYGKEQKITDEENQFSKRLSHMKLQLYVLDQQYEELHQAHKTIEIKYNRWFSEHSQKVERYNNLVKRRKNTGVLSREEKEKLTELEKQIKALEQKLRSAERDLNKKVEQLQALSNRIDEMEEQANRQVYVYNSRFEPVRMFHQGEYVNDTNREQINIYEFENKARLQLVLAHEVGHALGLKHNQNPASVMYFHMEAQQVAPLQLTAEDKKSVQRLCSN